MNGETEIVVDNIRITKKFLCSGKRKIFLHPVYLFSSPLVARLRIAYARHCAHNVMPRKFFLLRGAFLLKNHD